MRPLPCCNKAFQRDRSRWDVNPRDQPPRLSYSQQSCSLGAVDPLRRVETAMNKGSKTRRRRGAEGRLKSSDLVNGGSCPERTWPAFYLHISPRPPRLRV